MLLRRLETMLQRLEGSSAFDAGAQPAGAADDRLDDMIAFDGLESKRAPALRVGPTGKAALLHSMDQATSQSANDATGPQRTTSGAWGCLAATRR